MEDRDCILFVDDDAEIQSLVRLLLRNAGFEVILADNGVQALNRWQNSPVDLVILDIMMPILDGLEVCRKIRSSSDIPIIFLSVKGDEDDIVKGFNAGANDYVVKPFQSKELVARVQSILGFARRRTPPLKQQLVYEDLVLDSKSRTICRGEQVLRTSADGFRLLQYLMQHTGEVVKKEELVRNVWGFTDIVEDMNLIEAAIMRLRKALDDDPKDPHYIYTVWGAGYRFGKSFSTG